MSTAAMTTPQQDLLAHSTTESLDHFSSHSMKSASSGRESSHSEGTHESTKLKGPNSINKHHKR